MRFLILIYVFLSIPHVANSEPSKSFSYLMKEPLTLLEWGIYKLDKRLDSFKFEKLGLDLVSKNSGAYYDWDTNQLNIKYNFYPRYNSLDHSTKKDTCSNIISSIKARFTVKYKKSTRMHLGISNFFKHTEFNDQNIPSEFIDEIEGATEIIVELRQNKKNKPPYTTTFVFCKSKLMEGDVYFK